MISLNALPCVKAVVLMTKTGAWIVDVDFTLAVPVVPTGPALVTIGTSVLRGTIDARATGRFSTNAHARIVAGAGGWDTAIPGQQLHNDAGVLSSAAYAAIAAVVKETVVELVPPRVFGSDYTFMRGAASSVFAGEDWWVDILGVTHVGPRIPLPMPPKAAILEWDPKTQVAIIASDVLIVPGMTLVDPRFGVATVDDVEHTFSEDGARAIAWCSTPSLAGAAASLSASPPPAAGAKIVGAIGAIAREACQVSTLKRYPYRVVVQSPDGRLNLQSTALLGEAPTFLKLIDVWAGIPGLSIKLTPTTVVMVAFLDQGDPQKLQPVVVGFDPDAPPAIEIAIAGLRFAIGEGSSPIMKATPDFLTWLAAVGTATGAGPPPPGLASLKGFTD